MEYKRLETTSNHLVLFLNENPGWEVLQVVYTGQMEDTEYGMRPVFFCLLAREKKGKIK